MAGWLVRSSALNRHLLFTSITRPVECSRVLNGFAWAHVPW